VVKNGEKTGITNEVSGETNNKIKSRENRNEDGGGYKGYDEYYNKRKQTK